MNYLLSLLLPLSALAVPTTTPSVIMPLRNTIKEGVFSPKISYQWGHPVLTNDVNLYYIYYGSFTNDQKETLEHFGDNIGDSTWYNINRSNLAFFLLYRVLFCRFRYFSKDKCQWEN
jgi:hypothetical protein